MDPRKFKTLTTSTPSVANPSATFGLASEASDPSTISGGSFAIGKLAVKHDAVFKKMTTLDWVLKAIETVGVPRKGASYLAILKWIVNNKENVKINLLKTNLRKAIEKALENGLIKRPAISKNVTGLRGYFLKNKDALTMQKIPKTKPARKLVEITNITKVGKMKNSAVKPKASAQLKSKEKETTKPLKLLTKSAKPNRGADTAGISSKPKTQLKSEADKLKTNAVEGKPKTHPKAKQVSNKPKILHKAVRPNTDAEAGPSYEPETQPKSKPDKANLDTETGPSNKYKTQPKSKAAKPNLDAIEPSTKLNTRAKTRTAKPNLDAETGPSNKPKTKSKTKATKPNIDVIAEPRAKPKTRAKPRAPKSDLDAKDGPKTQPESIAFDQNLDVEARPKTRLKIRAPKPNDAEGGPKTLPKSTAFEINFDEEAGPKTRPKTRAAKPNLDAKAGYNAHPRSIAFEINLDIEAGSETVSKAVANEPNPEDEHSSVLKTPPKTKAAVKPRPGKLPVPALKDILPHPKADSKTSKMSQKINPKKLYTLSGELPLNISREEFSDKELNVKPQSSIIRVARRNSLASDSEVIRNTKVGKSMKMTKNFQVKTLNKKETSETGPTVSRANKQRGKNNSADV